MCDLDSTVEIEQKAQLSRLERGTAAESKSNALFALSLSSLFLHPIAAESSKGPLSQNYHLRSIAQHVPLVSEGGRGRKRGSWGAARVAPEREKGRSMARRFGSTSQFNSLALLPPPQKTHLFRKK